MTAGIDWDTDGILTEQQELALMLAIAPPVTPEVKREIDRAHTAAMRAMITAQYPGIRVPGKGEEVPDGIGADAEPDLYG